MPNLQKSKKRSSAPARALLAWYGRHSRVLPWRAQRGKKAHPYRVWLSEIMLQQTTVAAVASYYRKFLARWPSVEDLAAAPLDDVLAAWAGLGYYAGGVFPKTAAEFRELPGVGIYTAAAIAAIAFDAPEAAMDANAERVIARYFAIRETMPRAKRAIRKAGQSVVPAVRAGDFAQALMDLGAAICTPKRPSCGSCPWTRGCAARKLGIQEQLPLRAAQRVRPLKRGAAFVARDAAGAVLLVRRPTNGLLGAMMQPPLGPWAEQFPTPEQARGQAPFPASWSRRAGIVRHGFTHFELEIEAYVVEVSKRRDLAQFAEHLWIAPERLDEVALPTVMRKIIAHALKGEPRATSQVRSARSR